MALKPGRDLQSFKTGYFSDSVMTRGGIVSVKTVGSGEALDDANAVAEYAAQPSGTKQLGFLMDDVVENDLTRVHKNTYKQEVEKGEKVTIVNRGWVTTNMIDPAVTVAAPQTAYVTASGLLSNIAENGFNEIVGEFETNVDEDGYARVAINLT